MIMALINILYSTLIIKNNIISKYNKILYKGKIYIYIYIYSINLKINLLKGA